MGNDDFSSVKLSVQLVPQPTDRSCWAASMAMIVGNRDNISIEAESIASAAEMTTTDSYGWEGIQTAVDHWNLREQGPACLTPSAWAAMLRTSGPIWIVETGNPYHAVVVIGIDGDGTPEGSTVYINNPWPPNSGVQEAKAFVDFENEFELGSGVNAQNVTA